MQGIILCGGLGTRLRSVIGEKQKTMTETNGEPFVVNVLKYLKKYGVDDIIFATGYKSEEVENYFGSQYYFGMKVSYAKETEPLGTAGAIKNAISLVKDESVVVVNGDTLFPANIEELKEFFVNEEAEVVIACKTVDDSSRYGTIIFDKLKDNDNGTRAGVIKSFNEKISDMKTKEAYINGGVYIIKKTLIEEIPINKNISLEKEMIPKWIIENKKIVGMISDENFIDIGTPESLEEYKKRYSEWF